MKLPRGRTVAYTIAGLLCAVGSLFLIASHRYRRDFHRWQTARPIDIAVDMSAPGEYAGVFRQTCQVSHGEALCLLLPASAFASSAWADMLQDLRFVARIRDRNGTEKVHTEFTGGLPWQDELLDGAIPLCQFAPFAKGDYRLTLTVSEGVPALAGVPQRLVARYILCGLEMMPASVASAVGIGSLVIAGLTGLVAALAVSARRQARLAQPTTA